MAALEWTFLAPTAADTARLAAYVAEAISPGQVVALVGELGAGKTTFAQSFARAFGVHQPEEVVSPTYTLVNEYPGARGVLLHLDFYRLKDRESAVALGLEEQVHRRDGAVLVEWANLLPDFLPTSAIWIRFDFDDGDGRTMQLSGLPEPEFI